ncbi:hypothetical protein [Bradyrhizobium sp. Ec3.3]|uniref:hypothetical protein n=1 Tax=Bradyrhizobium sp. Ec3.3 TaxID=189753 RepID=UPI000422728C|nr:hypothetical protein [Bradyrhizobium sp. Ec3.3]
MSDSNALSTVAISSVVALIVSGLTSFTTIHVTNSEIAQKKEELQLKRRGERLENYQTAIDLLTDYGWRSDDPKYRDAIVREFTIPLVQAANRLRVYGSPATIAAMDEIQGAFGMLNKAKRDSERADAEKAISLGLDHLVIAAREDVGPKKEDDLKDVPFRQGAGPRAN